MPAPEYYAAYLEYGASASGASSVVSARLDDGRVGEHERRLRRREGLLKAGLAVDLLVGRVHGALKVGVEQAVTLAAVEALLVPVGRAGGAALGLENLRSRNINPACSECE